MRNSAATRKFSIRLRSWQDGNRGFPRERAMVRLWRVDIGRVFVPVNAHPMKNVLAKPSMPTPPSGLPISDATLSSMFVVRYAVIENCR